MSALARTPSGKHLPIAYSTYILEFRMHGVFVEYGVR